MDSDKLWIIFLSSVETAIAIIPAALEVSCKDVMTELNTCYVPLQI